MLSLLLSSKFSKPLIIAVIIIGALSGIYWKGWTDHAEYVELQKLKDNLDAVEDSQEIRNETETLSDYDQCIEHGGLSDECSELVLRMGKTTEAE